MRLIYRPVRRAAHRRGQRAVTIVEFAICVPVVLGMVFGIIDFARYAQITNTVAEAARQGARQAVPRAAAGDSPFGSFIAGTQCSGQVFAANANTQGCLTDDAIQATVASAMGGVLKPSSITVKHDTDPAGCAAQTPLATGLAYVCISPADGTSTGGTTTSHTTACPTGYPTPVPASAAATRKTEWTSHALDGCYYVSVTVVYFYRPWTPFLSNLMGTRAITSSTTVIAEY